jgi:hypothetical protein
MTPYVGQSRAECLPAWLESVSVRMSGVQTRHLAGVERASLVYDFRRGGS